MPGQSEAASAARSRRQRKFRRRLTGALVLALGLLSAGFLASALTPTPQVATANEDQVALIRKGQQLYETSCVTCHGVNLQGVQDRGPSLIGVGEAAVYFQVSSGRMPASRNEAQALRKEPKFDAAQIDAAGQAGGNGRPVGGVGAGEDGAARPDGDPAAAVASVFGP